VFAQHLLSAPASQAYIERIISVCELLTSGRCYRKSKSLQMRVCQKLNSKILRDSGFVYLKQEAQLSQRDRATLRLIEYFAIYFPDIHYFHTHIFIIYCCFIDSVITFSQRNRLWYRIDWNQIQPCLIFLTVMPKNLPCPSIWTLLYVVKKTKLKLQHLLYAWHSGRTSVFDRRTFAVLCSTCSWWLRVTMWVNRPL